jgi:cold shock CspA family protein
MKLLIAMVSFVAFVVSSNSLASGFGTDHIGQVRSFDFEKGRGYLAPFDGGAAILFHGAWGIGNLTDGTCVTYDIQEFPDHHHEAVNLQRAQCD